MYIGWDWAGKTHDVTVLDEQGRVVEHFAVGHHEAGFEHALTRLGRHGRPEELPVAIERPSGLVVERLVEARHPVIPIHPNAFNAARSRWGASRAKSDPGDSYRLADYLRTDGRRLRRQRPMDAATRNLQALVRMRDDHVEARIAASNQLEALLHAHWPGAICIFANLASDIALDFLDRYPTPDSAARLGETRLAAFLTRHSYCGRRSPAQLSSDCAERRPPPVDSTRRSWPNSSGIRSASCAPSSTRAKNSNTPLRPSCRITPRPPSSPACLALAPASTWPRSSARWDRSSMPASTSITPLPSVALARSPKLLDKAAGSTFAGPSTPTLAKPCSSLPTTLATPRLGLPGSTPSTSPPASAIRTLSASSCGPGSA